MPEKTVEFLTLDFPPVGGGIARYLYEIVSHLPAEAVRVTAVDAPNWQAFDAQQDFAIERLAIPSTWQAFQRELKFFAPHYLRALLKKRDLAFILCGQAHYSLLLPAWAISRWRGVPFGVFTFGLDLLYPQTTRYGRAFNRLLGAANVIFADSAAAERILQDLGIAQEKITVVYPSASGDGAPPDARLVAELRQQLGLEGRKCLLTVGRLIERKGHDTVLRALPQILAAVPETHYLIVGEGENEARLKALAQELDLMGHVTFAGYAGDEEVAACYALCDVFTMISREIPEKGDVEGFGIVYLEANLRGKPVVAGNSGGVPEAVLHQETGLLVDPTDVQEVATAVIRLLQDKELATRYGQRGRVRVLQEFSSQAAADKVHARLQMVMKS